MQSKLQLELSKLKWNAESLVLPKLLDKYPLPMIVKVTEGFYGESDDSTLCNGTVLCLHSVETGEKVHGRLWRGRGKDILIPLDCRSKVEVRRSDLKDVYESVEELCLCKAFPKYVRVSQGCYAEPSGECLVEVGDKLQLKGVSKKKKKQETLICFDQHCRKIELPKDTVAGFQPLTDGKEYYLSDALKKFEMPLNVQFLEIRPNGIDEDSGSPNESPCKPYQAVRLDRVSKETVVTATSIRTDGKHHLIQFSRDMNVGLSVCEETFTSGEYYPNISKILNLGKEKTETHAYEYIDPATIMSSRQTHVAKPTPDPPPKKPKPAVSAKPKLKNKTSVDAESNPLYEAIEESQYSECQVVVKDPAYTELNPTYVSNQKYEELIVQQSTVGTDDQPEMDIKRKVPPGAIALPPIPSSAFSKGKVDKPPMGLPKLATQPKNTSSKPGECPTSPAPALPERNPSVSVPKLPPALPPRPGSVSLPPNTQPPKTDSPPESPNNLPDPQLSLQTVDKSVASHESTSPSEQEREDIYQAIAQYPLDLSGLNVAAVGRLLKYLGMEKHVETFENELIDGSMLASLDKESLQSLDVISSFHVKKLLNFIGGWRPKV